MASTIDQPEQTPEEAREERVTRRVHRCGALLAFWSTVYLMMYVTHVFAKVALGKGKTNYSYVAEHPEYVEGAPVQLTEISDAYIAFVCVRALLGLLCVLLAVGLLYENLDFFLLRQIMKRPGVVVFVVQLFAYTGLSAFVASVRQSADGWYAWSWFILDPCFYTFGATMLILTDVMKRPTAARTARRFFLFLVAFASLLTAYQRTVYSKWAEQTALLGDDLMRQYGFTVYTVQDALLSVNLNIFSLLYSLLLSNFTSVLFQPTRVGLLPKRFTRDELADLLKAAGSRPRRPPTRRSACLRAAIARLTRRGGLPTVELLAGDNRL